MVNLPADDYALLADALAARDPWREQAACADADVPMDYFFPDPGNELIGAHTIRRGRLLCARCPVRLSCLVKALEEHDTGIWAGTTEEMREATANLPLPERVRTLDRQFYRIATRGPWRVVGRDEWEELGSGETQAHDRDDLRSPSVLSA